MLMPPQDSHASAPRSSAPRLAVAVLLTAMLLPHACFAAGFAVTTVDSAAGASGSLCSVAIDSTGAPHILYVRLDPTVLGYTGSLRHAYLSGGRWVSEQVDAGPFDYQGNTAMVFDRQGVLHVSYALSIVIGVGTQLKYARRTGTGWVSEIVESGAYVGTHPSIAMDPLNRPHLSYLVSTGYNTLLYHAVKQGTAWQKDVVTDDVSASTGIVRIGTDGVARVVYKTGFPNVVHLATRVSAGNWREEIVDESDNLVATGISFLLDSHDRPYLSYFDYNHSLGRYAAKPYGEWVIETTPATSAEGGLAMERDSIPNVGYVTLARDFPFAGTLYLASRRAGGWSTTWVDSAAGPMGNCALAIDASARAHLAYQYSYGFYSPSVLRYAVTVSLAARAGRDTTVECVADGDRGTPVRLDGSASEGTGLAFHWSAPGGTFDDPSSATPTGWFPTGTTPVVLELSAGGATDRDTVVVTVVDTRSPTIHVTLTPTQLWPPNHKLVAVHATVRATDACDAKPVVRLVSVTSSETDHGIGNPGGEADIESAQVGAADFDLDLRAERNGNGPGRDYTVCYEVVDAAGHAAQACARVAVPHDQGESVSGDRRAEKLNGGGAPAALAFAAEARPNPAPGRAVIVYTLPHGGHVRLTMYDVAGHVVARLVDGPQSAGRHEADFAREAARGAQFYFYRIEWEGGRLEGKVCMIR